MAIALAPNFTDEFTEGCGGRVVVHARAEYSHLVAAVRAAARAIGQIPHPEEPDDSYVNFISAITEHEGGLTFDVDAKDLNAYPEVGAEMVDALVDALRASGLQDATVSLLLPEAPEPEAAPPPTAIPPRMDPYVDLGRFGGDLAAKRRLLDWYVRELAPMTLRSAGCDAPPLLALGSFTQSIDVAEAIGALTHAMRTVTERIGPRPGNRPGHVGVREELERSVRQGEDWEEIDGRNLDYSVVHVLGRKAAHAGVRAREVVWYDVTGRNDTGRDVVDLVWSSVWHEVATGTFWQIWSRAHTIGEEATGSSPGRSLFNPREIWDDPGRWFAWPLLEAAGAPGPGQWGRFIQPVLDNDAAWLAFRADLADAETAEWRDAFATGLEVAFEEIVDVNFRAEQVVGALASITLKLMELTRFLFVLEARARAYASGADDNDADRVANDELTALMAESYRALDAFLATQRSRPLT